jgi:PilZ domain
MEQRRTRRFQLELPLSITRSGSARVTFSGLTRNISSSGVLFTAGGGPDLGVPIEYVIVLHGGGPQPVRLRCVGKVVRAEPTLGGPNEPDGSFRIAATLERWEFVRDRLSEAVPQ